MWAGDKQFSVMFSINTLHEFSYTWMPFACTVVTVHAICVTVHAICEGLQEDYRIMVLIFHRQQILMLVRAILLELKYYQVVWKLSITKQQILLFWKFFPQICKQFCLCLVCSSLVRAFSSSLLCPIIARNHLPLLKIFLNFL